MNLSSSIILLLASLTQILPLGTSQPVPLNQFDQPLSIRTIPSSDIDLPDFITAVFNGIANVIAASGAAAANTIAATGGAVANGLGDGHGSGTVPTTGSPGMTVSTTSVGRNGTTLYGRAIGEEVGRVVAREIEGYFGLGLGVRG